MPLILALLTALQETKITTLLSRVHGTPSWNSLLKITIFSWILLQNASIMLA